MIDEGLVHTDPVHDLVGAFYKMIFDIVGKDFVAIAWFHEVFSGIYFLEHDYGSTATSFVSCRLDSSHRVRRTSRYAGSILIANDSTLPNDSIRPPSRS